MATNFDGNTPLAHCEGLGVRDLSRKEPTIPEAQNDAHLAYARPQHRDLIELLLAFAEIGLDFAKEMIKVDVVRPFYHDGRIAPSSPSAVAQHRRWLAMKGAIHGPVPVRVCVPLPTRAGS